MLGFILINCSLIVLLSRHKFLIGDEIVRWYYGAIAAFESRECGNGNIPTQL